MPEELQPIASRFGVATGDSWEIVAIKLMEKIEELDRSVVRLNAITMGLSDQAANMDALQRAHSTALGGAG